MSEIESLYNHYINQLFDAIHAVDLPIEQQIAKAQVKVELAIVAYRADVAAGKVIREPS